jgi:hypothetical protein
MKDDEVGGTCGTHGRGERVFFFVGRPEGKRQLGRPRRRWEDNIKIVREIGIDEANWIRLAEDRVRWRAFVKVRYFLIT